MNRTEKRATLRILKRKKGLQKKTTKGASGKLPQYIIDDRKSKSDKKLQRAVDEGISKNPSKIVVGDFEDYNAEVK